jgi:colicin import membrane protein
MHAAADRPEFAPPPTGGLLRGVVIALLAHLLLLSALMWGVQWKRDSQDMAAEAELWASVPQEAAPQPVVVAPPPPPPPQPVAKEEPKPEPPKPKEPDINLQREKEKREAAKRAAEEEQERKERARKLAAEKKREQEKQAAAELKKKKEAEEKKRQEREEQLAKALREENLARMRSLAGASDNPNARGTAAQSAGPSASWAGRVRGRVKPNIVFSDDIPGNPSAEVEVKLAPDGTIVSRRLVKSSGHKAWDDAVLRALDKTEVLPRDTDGRVPPAGVLVFRPRD